MALYKAKITTELWTRTGSRTGIFLPVGTVLETGIQLTVAGPDIFIQALKVPGIA